MIRHAGWLATGALALLVLWAPLPFGSVTPAGSAALEIGAFLALALAAATAEDLSGARRVALPLAALAGIAALALAQSLAWPERAVALIAPEHARLAGEARALLEERAVPPEEPPSAPSTALSLAPSASRDAALAWAAATAALAAAALVGRDRRHRRLLAAAFAAAAVVQVTYGAQRWFARADEIWGVRVPGTSARLRGTFVNPDHLALLLGLALPCAFAWGWWAARRARDEAQVDRRVLLVAPPVLLWLTLFAGLAFTGSRGGLAAAVAGVTAQGLLLAGAQRRWRPAPAGVLAAVVGVGVVAVIGLEEGLGRLLATTSYDLSWAARRQAYAATVELWQRFPLTGAGIGAFRDAFPLVQPADLAGTWRHAHSDPLELLATGGLLAAALAAAGAAGLVLRLSRVLGEGGRSEDRAAALAALGALAAAAVHEVVDFGLAIPANALALAVLAGGAASARTGRQRAAAGRRPAVLAEGAAGEPDLPGHHRAAGEALEGEEVEPARQRHGEGRRRARRHRR